MFFRRQNLPPKGVILGTVSTEHGDVRYRNLCGMAEAHINVGAQRTRGGGGGAVAP
jgi:hypothetical protein